MSRSNLNEDIDAKIALLEEEIRKTPYYKGTEHHIGHLKAKIAKLKDKERRLGKKGSRFGFIPKKEGDATVVFIGPPSVGKSTLLKKLTNAQARIKPWPFTTLTVIPGMLKYKGALIQIFDLPGIVKGAVLGSGKGKEVLAASRIADLLILVVDIRSQGRIESLLGDIQKTGVDKLPILTVINKIDLLKGLPPKNLKEKFFISAQRDIGLQELKKAVWQRLNLMRIYLRPKGGKLDFEKPLILKKRQMIKDVFGKVFPKDKRVNKIFLWGPSARFPGQEASLNQILKDEDIISFT